MDLRYISAYRNIACHKTEMNMESYHCIACYFSFALFLRFHYFISTFLKYFFQPSRQSWEPKKVIGRANGPNYWLLDLSCFLFFLLFPLLFFFLILRFDIFKYYSFEKWQCVMFFEKYRIAGHNWNFVFNPEDKLYFFL